MGTNRRIFLRATMATAVSAVMQPAFVRAQVRRPLSDIVVVLPGIMGSVLQKDGHDVWALSGAAFSRGLRTLGKSVQSLALSGDSADAALLDDGVVADRILPTVQILPGLWKIDGYTALAKAITTEFDTRLGLNYFEFAYDWRRDNRAAAHRLAKLAPEWLKRWREASGNSDAKLIFIAHSMGGLVARYFLEVLGGWRDARMLITFGTPFRGSLKALNFIANGLKKSIGPLTLIDLSTLVRSFTSVYQLLPTYPCYDRGDGELQRVDAIDGIVSLDIPRASAALSFHEEIRMAVEENSKDSAYQRGHYTVHPIVGTHQPTPQIGRRTGGRVVMLDRHPRTDAQGDGTVPQVSATPIEPEFLTRQHRIVYAAEAHASLQNCVPVLDHLRALLAEGAIPRDAFRAQQTKAISVAVEDMYSTREPVRLKVGCEDADTLLVVMVLDAETGREVVRFPVARAGAEMQMVDCGRLAQGAYRLKVVGSDGGSASDVFLVVEA